MAFSKRPGKAGNFSNKMSNVLHRKPKKEMEKNQASLKLVKKWGEWWTTLGLSARAESALNCTMLEGHNSQHHAIPIKFSYESAEVNHSFFYYFMCLNSPCTSVCAPCMPGVPEARRQCQIFWKWSYRWLLATMYVLEIKSGSSARAARANLTSESFPQAPIPIKFLMYL